MMQLLAKDLLMATDKLWNYQASGLVSDDEALAEATIPFANASEYLAELVAMVDAGDSAYRSFPKSSAGPV